jgi:hypothetical protein
LVENPGKETFHGVIGPLSHEVMMIGEGRRDSGNAVWVGTLRCTVGAIGTRSCTLGILVKVLSRGHRRLREYNRARDRLEPEDRINTPKTLGIEAMPAHSLARSTHGTPGGPRHRSERSDRWRTIPYGSRDLHRAPFVFET